MGARGSAVRFFVRLYDRGGRGSAEMGNLAPLAMFSTSVEECPGVYERPCTPAILTLNAYISSVVEVLYSDSGCNKSQG